MEDNVLTVLMIALAVIIKEIAWLAIIRKIIDNSISKAEDVFLFLASLII